MTDLKEFMNWAELKTPGPHGNPTLRVWRFSSYKALVEIGTTTDCVYYRAFYLDDLYWGTPFTEYEAIKRGLCEYLDGTIKPDWERELPKRSQQTCNCTLQTVMNIGCQCGGD